MLDLSFIRENPQQVKAAARAKGVEADVEKILSLDEKRREFLQKTEKLQAEQNSLGGEVAKLKGGERQKTITALKKLKEKIQSLEPKLKKIEDELNELLYLVPNLPRPDVKIGKDETENEVIKRVGKPPAFSFSPKEYMALGAALDLIDTDRAAKVSGSRFGYLKREAVLLEFALAQFAFDTLGREEFVPVVPPTLVGERAMRGMGYLDRGRDEIYHLPADNLFLVGTSEQSTGPMHMDEILPEASLPLRYVSFSSCYRREAGSYGKDTKGILRVHQFDKVEMFVYTLPEKSDAEHERLLALEEKLMTELGLPYQVVKMCTGDLGDPAARKYDIETWIPSQGKYRETHSTSTTTDFQARRLNIRFRRHATGKTEFVHMLNGTAFAVGRMLIAILENFQTAKGTILIPPALQKYCGFSEISRQKT